MTSFRHIILIAAVLGGVALPGDLTAFAHGLCPVVSISGMPLTITGIPVVVERSVVIQQGGFMPTPLDVWAFSTIPAAPTTTIVRQIVVCPSVVSPVIVSPSIVTAPVFVAPPLFVDPPAVAPRAPGVSSEGVPPPTVVVPAMMPPVTVQDLAQGPGQYDRQGVTLVGTATAPQESHDVRGSLYTEFRLENGGASVATLAWGSLRLREGQRVRVTGNFYAVAPFVLRPGAPVHDVLEANVIETLR